MSLKPKYGFAVCIFLSVTAHGLGVFSISAFRSNNENAPIFTITEVDVMGSSSHSHSLSRIEGKAERKESQTTVEETLEEGDRPREESSGQVYGEEEVDTAAEIRSSPKLRYPRQAFRDGVEGAVELYLLIDEQGKVVGKEITKSAGHGFDEAAFDAASYLKFSPAVKEGKPVRVHLHWTIYFRIDD